MGVPLRVLIVEDSEDDAELVALELRRTGYEVFYERVETPEAMRAALAGKTWDLIIADYFLPYFSALRALDVLKETGLDLPFILISGTIGEERAAATMKAGALDFLLKQNLARLSPAVSRELREAEVRRERRRAEGTLRFLVDAGLVLAESLDYDATLRRVARLAVPFLADWCLVDVVDEARKIRRVAGVHVDPAKEALLRQLRDSYPLEWNSPEPAARAIRTAEPQLFPKVDDAVLASLCRSPEESELARTLGIRTVIAVPLTMQSRMLGAITFASAAPGRAYGTSELALAQELARRAAIAIENARLFHELQDAVRARDEFLSIASHELKTPLTPLQLQVESAVRTVRDELTGDLARRMTSKLEVAQRQVLRLTKLVDNLLDISRITAQRLDLEYEVVDFASLLAEVVSRFRQEAEQAGCTMTLQAGAPVVGTWDRLRLEQIVTNLVSNATKYGAEKPIEICLEADADVARLTVRDHGIGIAPAAQARIFERFGRAVSERHYGGLGLGLWIVRQIVEALGGRIWVRSQLGAGATFTVELPRARGRLPPIGSPAGGLESPPPGL